MIYRIEFFGRKRKTTEQPLRLGFELHNYRVSFNINIPHFFRFALYSHPPKRLEMPDSYGIEHIYDFRIKNIFRTGFDSYKGEFALLFPILKFWIQCDFMSNNFRQFGRFSFLILLLKLKWNELTFRFGVLGFRFSFRIGR